MRDLHCKEFLRHAKAYVVREYGPRGYAFWRNLITGDPIFLRDPDDSGIEIEISSLWDHGSPVGSIRVVVSLFEAVPVLSIGAYDPRVPTTSFLVFEDEHIELLEDG